MRVLVVEDEPRLAEGLRAGLVADGFAVDLARTGPDGLWLAREEPFDAIVLDLMLPGIDGFRLCRQLRADGIWTPVLMLTARAAVGDEVAGLDAGADDYLTKPFGIDELMARVRALLRRAGAQGTPRPVRFRADDLEIDLDARRITRAGVEVRLTKTEWALLAELCQHPGKLLTHRWLLERVWGPGYAGDVDVLRVFISQLRKKLEHDPGRPKLIATDPGIGYRWLLRAADESEQRIS
jgi:two-component system, OmpR family, response regulator